MPSRVALSDATCHQALTSSSAFTAASRRSRRRFPRVGARIRIAAIASRGVSPEASASCGVCAGAATWSQRRASCGGARRGAVTVLGMESGTVESIHLASVESGPTFAVGRVRALAGRGLEGDRNLLAPGADGAGRSGEDLTLIEAEAIEGLARDTGIELGPGGSRRNLVTRGIRLNDLVGRRFTVGGVPCLGVERCEPCNHLQGLTAPGVLRGLVHRGGLRADLLGDGEIAVGDAVVAEA